MFIMKSLIWICIVYVQHLQIPLIMKHTGRQGGISGDFFSIVFVVKQISLQISLTVQQVMRFGDIGKVTSA